TTRSAKPADIAIPAVPAKADAAALGIPIIAAVHMSASWHYPEMPESPDYFRLLTCCGLQADLAADSGGVASVGCLRLESFDSPLLAGLLGNASKYHRPRLELTAAGTRRIPASGGELFRAQISPARSCSALGGAGRKNHGEGHGSSAPARQRECHKSAS